MLEKLIKHDTQLNIVYILIEEISNAKPNVLKKGKFFLFISYSP